MQAGNPKSEARGEPTGSPDNQLTGVATWCFAISYSESITCSTSSKLRRVVEARIKLTGSLHARPPIRQSMDNRYSRLDRKLRSRWRSRTNAGNR
jgi:hypothetical protein